MRATAGPGPHLQQSWCQTCSAVSVGVLPLLLSGTTATLHLSLQQCDLLSSRQGNMACFFKVAHSPSSYRIAVGSKGACTRAACALQSTYMAEAYLPAALNTACTPRAAAGLRAPPPVQPHCLFLADLLQVQGHRLAHLAAGQAHVVPRLCTSRWTRRRAPGGQQTAARLRATPGVTSLIFDALQSFQDAAETAAQDPGGTAASKVQVYHRQPSQQASN